MLKKIRSVLRIILLCALAGGLAACASTQDTVAKPADLEDFSVSAGVNSLWSVSTGAGHKGKYLNLQPAKQQQQLFTVDTKGVVTALHATSGEVNWQKDLQQVVTAGVGIDTERLYVGTDEGVVLALNVANGDELWRAKVSSEILAKPVAAAGRVVVHAADGKIFALDAADGKEVWQFISSPPALSLRGSSTPVIVDNLVLVGLSSGKVAIFNLQTGDEQAQLVVTQPRGRSELQRLVDINGEVLLHAGVLYAVTYQGRVAAIDTQSGHVLWQREMSSYRNMDIDYRALYVSAADGTVWALDKKTGATLWQQNSLANRLLSAPRVVKDTVLVGDLDGYLHILSADSGEFFGRQQLSAAAIVAQPLVDNNIVYVLDSAGTLQALELKS